MSVRLETTGMYDVAIIGAGPAGSVAAALLCQQGYRVLLLEREQFPRFVIGESLLPQCMSFLEQAGLLELVNAQGYQFKDGAAFSFGELSEVFNFTEKFSAGPGTTFQVPRESFDQVLAAGAAEKGAEIRFGQTVTAIGRENNISWLDVSNSDTTYRVTSRFVLDASGYGRVLPRLLGLDQPSSLVKRQSLMTHVEDHIAEQLLKNSDLQGYERNKILISVHPKHPEVWYWLIPFSHGRSSVGIVATPEFFANYEGDDEQVHRQLVSESGLLADLLKGAIYDTPLRAQVGYSCSVTQLYGEGFALLGNAGEFLDPVFSSGVTIAMKSSVLAAATLHRELQGEEVDWAKDYAKPLMQGVNTFREFVEAWYDGRLQQIIFSKQKNPELKRMISAILAGYAWDMDNPYVKNPKRLTTLAELCK